MLVTIQFLSFACSFRPAGQMIIFLCHRKVEGKTALEIVHERVLILLRRDYESRIQKCRGRWKKLCESLALLSAKFTVMERRIYMNSDLLSLGKSPTLSEKVECLKIVLRHNFCVLMQRTLRTTARKKMFEGTNGYLPANGVFQNIVRTSTDCMLEHFSLLAEDIFLWNIIRRKIEVQFFPAFHYTQDRADNAKEFCKSFSSLGVL